MLAWLAVFPTMLATFRRLLPNPSARFDLQARFFNLSTHLQLNEQPAVINNINHINVQLENINYRAAQDSERIVRALVESGDLQAIVAKLLSNAAPLGIAGPSGASDRQDQTVIVTPTTEDDGSALDRSK